MSSYKLKPGTIPAFFGSAFFLKKNCQALNIFIFSRNHKNRFSFVGAPLGGWEGETVRQYSSTLVI